jgi:hypothetical protein
MIEIERKFKVPRKILKQFLSKIKQGYLSSVAERTVCGGLKENKHI